LLPLSAKVTVPPAARSFGPGTVRFVGRASVGDGLWAGVELDRPLGKRSGPPWGGEAALAFSIGN
jgi:dynactin complex subunit